MQAFFFTLSKSLLTSFLVSFIVNSSYMIADLSFFRGRWLHVFPTFFIRGFQNIISALFVQSAKVILLFYNFYNEYGFCFLNLTFPKYDNYIIRFPIADFIVLARKQASIVDCNFSYTGTGILSWMNQDNQSFVWITMCLIKYLEVYSDLGSFLLLFYEKVL